MVLIDLYVEIFIIQNHLTISFKNESEKRRDSSEPFIYLF